MRLKVKLIQISVHILLLMGGAIALIPLISMVSTSFMDIRGLLPEKPVITPDFPLYLENYKYVWNNNNFSAYFLNSILVTGVGLAINITISIVTAYGFSRFTFPGKEFIFNLFLLTMMIPSMLAIIPQYTVINALGLVDSYNAVWLLYAGGCVAGNVFFYRGFFERIPHELEESMFIDGAGRWRILFSIVIPLSKPAIGTSAIFAFNGYWSDLFTVLTFIKTESKRTLPVALQFFRGKNATNYGLLFAASVIVLIPVILVFILFQKQFLKQGLSDGSLKG